MSHLQNDSNQLLQLLIIVLLILLLHCRGMYWYTEICIVSLNVQGNILVVTSAAQHIFCDM